MFERLLLIGQAFAEEAGTAAAGAAGEQQGRAE